MTLFLSRGEAVLSLRGAEDARAVVRMAPVGAVHHPHGVGLEPQITKTNYLLGNDPRQWHTEIANFGRVRYPDVYPGIDVVYRGNQRRLEFDLVVAPGADPKQIRFALSGADSIEIDPQGELVLHTAAGDLVQPAPTVYQETGKVETSNVEGHYVLLAAPEAGGGEGARRQVGFAVGRYDRSRPLIIDPIIVYSTFLGGSGDEWGQGIAVDGTGNAYVTGYTTSTTFPGVTAGSIQPANGGGKDAFVTKINAAGTAIVYSTFLGGSGDDYGVGIAVDGAGNAYVTGLTTSTTFPGVTAGSIQPANGGGNGDAFVTKINAAGTAIVYSTFLGGSGGDLGTAIAVDGTGSTYVAGYTASTTFPGVTAGSIQPANGGGGSDGFVIKINATGTAIVYSTFLGGSGDDSAQGIAIDGTGNAYVTGHTNSSTFPGVTGGSIQPANGGGLDAFVTKINAAGTAIVYSTFLGGSGSDLGQGIAVDGTGSAYVTGFTSSTAFPGVTAGSIQPALAGSGDAFVTKINAAGTAIVYSTFLGGGSEDQGSGIAVDATGNAYVTGYTLSMTFPGVTAGSIQPANGGEVDGFVTKINAAGTAIVYSTFLGGSGSDEGLGIALDGTGNAYVTGFTNSTTFPGVTAGSIQPANGGGFDAFVTKIGLLLATQASASVPVGGTISDTATLAGGTGPTGTITFTAFANATCTGTPTFTSAAVTVSGNGSYPSGSFVTTAAGTYNFVASYSGDGNNSAVTTACLAANESVVVTAVTPTLATQASASVRVGGAISDTATLAAGFNPTGTITFTAFANSTCIGTPAFTSAAVTVGGNGSYPSGSFVTTAAGTYNFVASYSGDGNNDAVTTACLAANESVVVTAATPTITGQASPGTTVGSAISDTATLAGGDAPTGTITFTLFGPADPGCGGPPIATSMASVNGNGSYAAASFVTMQPGTYHWVASYSGGPNDTPAGPTSCGDPAQAVTITATIAAIPALDPRGLALLTLGLAAAGFLTVRKGFRVPSGRSSRARSCGRRRRDPARWRSW